MMVTVRLRLIICNGDCECEVGLIIRDGDGEAKADYT